MATHHAIYSDASGFHDVYFKSEAKTRKGLKRTAIKKCIEHTFFTLGPTAFGASIDMRYGISYDKSGKRELIVLVVDGNSW